MVTRPSASAPYVCTGQNVEAHPGRKRGDLGQDWGNWEERNKEGGGLQLHAHVVVGQDLPGHARVPSSAWVFRRMLSVKVVPSLARSRKRFMNGLRWPWGSSINDIHFEGVGPKACNSTDKQQVARGVRHICKPPWRASSSRLGH